MWFSCSRCAFSTLRYDKLKEHLHKQHKVGSAPERRVRITDLVNFDELKTIEGSATQSLPPSSQQQSLDTSVTAQPVSCVVNLNISGGNACPEKQQSIVDSSVMLVEPADFLLSNIQVQPLTVLPASDARHTTVTPEDVAMSSVLLDADLVKEN